MRLDIKADFQNWVVEGADPYAVTIQNLIKGKANELSTFRSNKAGGASENGIFAQGKF